MGTSKLHKGWGTFKLNISMYVFLGMVSSCAENKTSVRELEPTFDFFTEECVPASSIVGGEFVRPADLDSRNSVLLIWKDQKGGQGLCSSTLISERTLLTAAHCVNEAVQIQAVFYTDTSCRNGYRRSQHAIVAQEFKSHPEYVSDIKKLKFIDENPDVALVHLSKPAPAYYPIFRIHNSPETLTSDIFLYGYGVTSALTQDSMLLRKTTVLRQNIFFTNKAVFFDQENRTGVCRGDSGGAGLMDENGELVVASVNSEVVAKSIVEDDYCNGYSKSIVVHHYKDWIQSIMNQWNEKLK